MKPSIILALIGLAGEAVAFPAIMKAYMAESFDKQARSASPPPVKRVLGVNPGFNAAAQHVSTEGPHAFIAPGPGDARGPCPGLNAMANHSGYFTKSLNPHMSDYFRLHTP